MGVFCIFLLIRDYLARSRDVAWLRLLSCGNRNIPVNRVQLRDEYPLFRKLPHNHRSLLEIPNLFPMYCIRDWGDIPRNSFHRKGPCLSSPTDRWTDAFLSRWKPAHIRVLSSLGRRCRLHCLVSPVFFVRPHVVAGLSFFG